MGLFDDTPDLGAAIGGAAKNTWQSLVDDRVKQNALISFGLQMMVGGHGSPVQQIGEAASHGMESAGKTAGLMQQARETEEAKGTAAREKEADRANRVETAKIGADSRAEVANIRSAAMLDRTRMNLEGKTSSNPALALKYRTEARKIIEGDSKALGLPTDQRLILIEETANRLYDVDLARGRLNSGEPKKEAPSGSSALGDLRNSNAAPAPKLPDEGGKQKDLWGLLQGPQGTQLKERLKTQEGIEWLRQKRPDLGKQLDYYWGMQGAYGGKEE